MKQTYAQVRKLFIEHLLYVVTVFHILIGSLVFVFLFFCFFFLTSGRPCATLLKKILFPLRLRYYHFTTFSFSKILHRIFFILFLYFPPDRFLLGMRLLLKNGPPLSEKDAFFRAWCPERMARYDSQITYVLHLIF